MPSSSRRSIVAISLLSLAAAGCLDENLIKQPDLVINPGLPAAWTGTQGTSAIGTTPTDQHGGTTAAYLSNAFNEGLRQFVMTQTIKADDFRGKRVKLSAWVRPRNVSSVVSSGLWMRVDGPGVMLQFDNMSRRPISGYGDWRQVAIVLDVPANAIGISFGVLFQATNTLLVDDMTLTVVDASTPSTNTGLGTESIGTDSAGTVALYDRAPLAPRNLDFEGVRGFDASTAAWINGNSTALTTTDPTANLDELEPFRTMVGTAHVVGLGEATHGTKEFALLKHRLVRFLVSRMGFTNFAIEATAPEADDLNEYLRTGTGDPARLLSHLYFWTWNTREVADMIAWMRQWNSTAPANAQVRFRGIDIQYPSASIDSVKSFMHRVAPNLDADIAAKYDCLTPYRNTGNLAGKSRTDYLALASEPRQLCNEAMTAALALVRAQSASAPGYQAALHSARLVQQFESMLGAATPALSNLVRDSAMAENVAWLRDQAGSDSKLIVWAHNDHITRQQNQMGGFIKARSGDDYRPLAFAFGTGSFNAVKQTDNTFFNVISHSTDVVLPQSVEDAFSGAASPIVLMDMRKTSGSTDPAGRVLRGPIAMRSIGCCFDASKENQYFGQIRLFPSDYDLLLYVRTSTPSTLLPYIN